MAETPFSNFPSIYPDNLIRQIDPAALGRLNSDFTRRCWLHCSLGSRLCDSYSLPGVSRAMASHQEDCVACSRYVVQSRVWVLWHIWRI